MLYNPGQFEKTIQDGQRNQKRPKSAKAAARQHSHGLNTVCPPAEKQ